MGQTGPMPVETVASSESGLRAEDSEAKTMMQWLPVAWCPCLVSTLPVLSCRVSVPDGEGLQNSRVQQCVYGPESPILPSPRHPLSIYPQ